MGTPGQVMATPGQVTATPGQVLTTPGQVLTAPAPLGSTSKQLFSSPGYNQTVASVARSHNSSHGQHQDGVGGSTGPLFLRLVKVLQHTAEGDRTCPLQVGVSQQQG